MKIIIEITAAVLFVLSVAGYLIGSSGSNSGSRGAEASTGSSGGMRFKNRLKIISKPLMMPLLILLYLLFTKTASCFIVTALAFGFLGDTFLLKPEKKAFFIAGLVSFLLGHLCYIYGFLQPISMIGKLNSWIIFPIYAFAGILIYKKLLPYLGSVKIPATVYLAVIFIMSFASFLRLSYYLDFRNLLPLAGSILFISSDTKLAFDKFKGSTKSSNLFKDITYVAAQILIAAGFTWI